MNSIFYLHIEQKRYAFKKCKYLIFLEIELLSEFDYNISMKHDDEIKYAVEIFGGSGGTVLK